MELNVAASKPTPVTARRPRLEPEPEPPALDRVAEERVAEEVQHSSRRGSEPEEQANGTAEPDLTEKAPSVAASSNRHVPDEPQDTLFERPAPEVLSLDDAALAIHACVPDGEKVERRALLVNAARELGHTKLTKKVRRTLNKALHAEHNAGRLKTDWNEVWKPRTK